MFKKLYRLYLTKQVNMKKTFLLILMCFCAMSNVAQISNSTTPYVLYGYLKVYPYDLGNFESEPVQIILNLNKQKFLGYSSWRVPTNDELALIRANKIITSGEYMSRENPKGILRLVTDVEDVVTTTLTNYVDLGLPSGTLWKDNNELGLYAYDEAMGAFGSKLPTIVQIEELKYRCTWSWMGTGYKVVGPNGNSIFLPADGIFVEILEDKGTCGNYWSSTPQGDNSCVAYGLNFYFYSEDKNGIYLLDYERNKRLSVRLVQN